MARHLSETLAGTAERWPARQLETFSRLLDKLDSTNVEKRWPIEDFLQTIPAADRSDFLWAALEHHLQRQCRRAVSYVRSVPVAKVFGAGQYLTVAAARRYLAEHTNYLDTEKLATHLRGMFARVQLDALPTLDDEDGSNWSWPFDTLSAWDRPDLVHLAANLGHDLHSIPALASQVQGYGRLLSANDPEYNDLFADTLQLSAQILPSLYPGLCLMMEAYVQMISAVEVMPQEVNIQTLLRLVIDEVALRALGKFDGIVYRGHKYIPNTEHGGTPQITVTEHVAANLNMTGDAAMLHLLFYQLAKNSAMLLGMKQYDIEEAHIQIDAQPINLRGVPAVAIRFIDNGPGLDLAGILRAKQKLVNQQPRPLLPGDAAIVDKWQQLGLRLVDLVKFIFERRVSALDRWHAPSSGIGLSLVDEIVRQHGGAVWVTNIVADFGAEFLIVLDTTASPNLHLAVPELFQDKEIPSDILNEVERQIDMAI